jgi:uncharacterized protein YecT (DUF1311 family)
LAVLVARCCFAGAAAGASFDCGLATTSVERLICRSPVLSGLDDQVAAAFRRRREALSPADSAALLQDQRRWAQARSEACRIPGKGDFPESRQGPAATCLEARYRARLAELTPPGAEEKPGDKLSRALVPTPDKVPSPARPPVAPVVSAPSVSAPIPPPTLAQSSLPAQGAAETLLTVAAFGRYAITVKSDQGTALQLIDRMAGPGPIQGIAGAENGRLDVFLDHGTEKIRLYSADKGVGEATLSVEASVERETAPVRLVPLKPVIGELDDHEQRSYWLEVKTRDAYSFEAGGRALADLRLWHDGDWVVDAEPRRSVHDSGAGQPQTLLQLSAELEPGTYKLTAYGGVSLPWASGAKAQPFLLRWGFAGLASADRSVHEASPLGIDRFLVPKETRQVRLVLDRAEPAAITLVPYHPAQPFGVEGDRATIDKTTRDPIAVVTPDGENAGGGDEAGSQEAGGGDNDSQASTPDAAADPEGRFLVTIERTPGARYRLELLNQDEAEIPLNFPDRNQRNYALALVKPGRGDDSIDPTALIRDSDDHGKVVAASALELDSALPWRRHFNLLQPQTMLLHTTTRLDLVVEGSGARAEFMVAPALTAPRGETLGRPKPKSSGSVWTLDPGYYLLTASPLAGGAGILTLSLYADKTPAPSAESARLAALIVPVFTAVPKHDYVLNSFPETGGVGLVSRPLPLTLAEAFAFEGTPGRSYELPIKLAEAGRLALIAEDGTDLPIAVDDQPATVHPDLGDGAHKLKVAGPTDKLSYVSLSFVPAALQPEAALPPLAAGLTQPPELPKRPPGPPAYVDLAQAQSLLFALPVEHPGLYRAESLGLVETSGAIRTRIQPSLAQDQAGGIGRNFLLQQYLREGDYQLSVKPAGKSYGRIGIAVTATPVAEQGLIEVGRPARLTLQPGQAARYRFHIGQAGEYRLHSQGLGRGFTMRLDDDEGWPLLAPGGLADATLKLAAGDYQMILLPQPLEARAVTLLERIEPPIERAGHGPFDVVFASDLENQWLEPESGQTRLPDRWRFTLPASADVTISTGSGMRAELSGPAGPGKSDQERAALTDRPWHGKLAAGNYVIEAMSAAPNNRVDYTLRVETAQLVAGERRSLQAPGELTVSLAGERQIELASFGAADVKARLFDARGRLVAANDDRENDWNFLIVGNFPAGEYKLAVDPVGTAGAETEIALDQPDEVMGPDLAFDAPLTLSDGKIHILALPKSNPGDLLLIGAGGDAPIGLALDGSSAANGGALTGWRQIAATSGSAPYLAMPRGDDDRRAYRLRVWSLDQAKAPIVLVARAVTPGKIGEAELADGATPSAVPLGSRQLGVAAVTLDRPGVLQLADLQSELLSAGTADTGLIHDPSGTLVAPGSTLWLVEGEIRKLIAKRVDPTRQPLRLTLGPDVPVSLPVAEDRDHLALWLAEGQGGEVGIAVSAGDGAGPKLMAAGADTGAFAAYAFAPQGLAKPALSLWQAGVRHDALPVTVSRIGFAAPRSLAASAGATDGRIGAREALALSLPAGPKRLALTAPIGAAIVLSKTGQAERLIRSAGTAAELFETDADLALLLNVAEQEAPFTVSVEPLAAPAAGLVPGQIMTRYSAVPAIWHLTAGVADRATTLFAAGAVRRVVAIDAQGQISRGLATEPGAGGLIDVEVKPGLAALVLDSGTAAPAAPDREIAVPGSIVLEGRRMALRLAAGPARLVHVETEAPIVLRGHSGSAPLLFTAGAALNLVQGEGNAADLEIEPAGTPMLSGMAQFDASAPLPITDGLGAKLRLPPGQSRLFSFAVTETRAIGIGARASVDIVSCRLLRNTGEEIGSGLVQLQTLQPGTYLLAIDVPADGVAVDIQPALVGLTLPGKGPPDEVKAQYLSLVKAAQK